MYFSTKHLQSIPPFRAYYVDLKTQYRKTVRSAKANKVLSHLNSSINKLKAVLNIIKEVRPNYALLHVKKIQIENDELISKPKKSADSFNSFFRDCN